MKWRLPRNLFGWLIVGGTVVLLAMLLFSPIGKPPDEVRAMHLSPKRNRLQREFIMSRHFGRSYYQPQSISLRSNGSKFRAYLLDLAPIEESRAKVETFMAASDRIERGDEPAVATVKHQAVNVSEARFGLSWLPYSLTHVEYMLIVAADEEVEVQVTINYGS